MAGLPEGLVTTSETITGEIESVDHVDVADIIKLWKAYSTNRRLLADGAGRRLENFFWRLLSSDHIVKSITGGQVAILFDAISEEGPLRTTPTQSPRASRVLGDYSRHIHPSQFQQPTSEVAEQSNGNVVSGTSAESLSQSDHVRVAAANLEEDPRITIGRRATYALQSAEGSEEPGDGHSLLRRKIVSDDGDDENTPTPTPPPTARRAEPSKSYIEAFQRSGPPPKPEMLRADSETSPPGSPTSVATVVSASSEDTVKGNLGSSHQTPKRKARKRGVYYASTPANKKRPVFMRRQSSQSSSSTASNTVSPRPSTSVARSLKDTLVVEHGEDPGDIAHTSEDAIEDDGSSPGETHETEASSSSSSSSSNTGSRSAQQRSALVEPGFRSKFVAQTRSAQSSFVSLPSLLRKPSATTATSASYQAAGNLDLGRQTEGGGRGGGRVTFSDQVVPLEPRGRAGSARGREEDQSSALPRTQSQLTLLLERSRRAGGQEAESKEQERPSR